MHLLSETKRLGRNVGYSAAVSRAVWQFFQLAILATTLTPLTAAGGEVVELSTCVGKPRIPELEFRLACTKLEAERQKFSIEVKFTEDALKPGKPVGELKFMEDAPKQGKPIGLPKKRVKHRNLFSDQPTTIELSCNPSNPARVTAQLNQELVSWVSSQQRKALNGDGKPVTLISVEGKWTQISNAATAAAPHYTFVTRGCSKRAKIKELPRARALVKRQEGQGYEVLVVDPQSKQRSISTLDSNIVAVLQPDKALVSPLRDSGKEVFLTGRLKLPVKVWVFDDTKQKDIKQELAEVNSYWVRYGIQFELSELERINLRERCGETCSQCSSAPEITCRKDTAIPCSLDVKSLIDDFRLYAPKAINLYYGKGLDSAANTCYRGETTTTECNQAKDPWNVVLRSRSVPASLGVLAHEFGHVLGLGHPSAEKFTCPFDSMRNTFSSENLMLKPARTDIPYGTRLTFGQVIDVYTSKRSWLPQLFPTRKVMDLPVCPLESTATETNCIAPYLDEDNNSPAPWDISTAVTASGMDSLDEKIARWLDCSECEDAVPQEVLDAGEIAIPVLVDAMTKHSQIALSTDNKRLRDFYKDLRRESETHNLGLATWNKFGKRYVGGDLKTYRLLRALQQICQSGDSCKDWEQRVKEAAIWKENAAYRMLVDGVLGAESKH